MLKNLSFIRLSQKSIVYIALGLGLVLNSSLSAQDSTFVECHKEKLTVRSFFMSENLSLSILNAPGNRQVNFVPNNNQRLGLGFNWKWLGLEVSSNKLFSNADTASQGVTKSFNLQTKIWMKQGLGFLYFQRFAGFYAKNTHELFPDWDDSRYYVRSDLRTETYGGSYIYVFNHKQYSFKAGYKQNVEQKKSAGSFVLMPSVRFLRVHAKHPLLPKPVLAHFELRDQLIHGKFWLMGLAPGYAYTLVKNRFYAKVSTKPGVTVQRHELLTPEGSQIDWRANFKGQFRIGAGFNFEKVFLGASYIHEQHRLNVHQSKYRLSTNHFRVWIGLRLGKGHGVYDNHELD